MEKGKKDEESKAKRKALKSKKKDEDVGTKEADPIKVEQLRTFYNKYDPPKAINADTLLSKYSIKALVKLLRQKYDDVPEGWEAEITEKKKDRKGKDSSKSAPSTPTAASSSHTNSASSTATIIDGDAGSSATGDTTSTVQQPGIAEGSVEELERRKQVLRAFYLAKDPSKISCIDQILVCCYPKNSCLSVVCFRHSLSRRSSIRSK